MKFYNRESEFKMLKSIKNNFRIAVIGRRRVGKTSLVENFYGKKCINLFVSAEKSEKEIVGNWIKEYSNLHLPQVNTFYDFFDFVFFHLKNNIIFIDELQNFLKVNKSFFSDLQRMIDKYKPNLVVSGSIISLMKELVEEYKSPLYGRFDIIIKLNELDFNTIHKICKDLDLDIEESINLYSIFGGIPKYFELIEKLEKFIFDEFIINSFVIYPRPLFEEIKTMLKEEFGSEYKTYFSILSAISLGKNKNSEIANYIGKKETEITKYLAFLKDDFEIIERKTPILDGGKGIYAIKNNVVNFWFANIWKYNEQIETLQEEKLKEIVKKSLDKHISFSFERIIIELMKKNIIFNEFKFTKIGSQWGKFKGEKGKNTYEIDIVGINDNTKQILFCECKWQENVDAEKILFELKEKVKYIDWNNDSRKENYAIFAKSFKKKTKEAKLYDLKEIERLINYP